MKVGILGGTFDPIHLGHTFIAKKAQETLGLDEIWFVPAGDPWLKRDREISLAKHRLEMVCLAVEDDQTFKVLDIEVRRPGPSYTVDTLLELRGELTEDDRLFFIVGTDALATLGRWHKPERLFDLCTIIGVSRPQENEINVEELNEIRTGASNQVITIDSVDINISGSQARARVANGMPLSGWVAAPVEEYILRNNLYKA